MAKLPQNRYPTCGALAEAAGAAIGGAAAPALKPGRQDAGGPPVPATDDTPTDAPTLVLRNDVAAVVRESELSLQLIPLESRARKTARHKVRVENGGDVPIRVELAGSGHTAARAEVSPESVVVEPRSVAWAGVWVRPSRVRAFWRRRLRFRVSARPDRAAPRTLEGLMVRPPRFLAWGLVTLLVAAGGVLGVSALRDGGGHEPGPRAKSGGGSPTPAAAIGICPLTGAPPSSGPVPEGPALAVKVDNEDLPEVRDSQHGLFRADLVFEEPIEGVLRTRFVAVFHCSMPDQIGPVRGPRPTDPDLLAQLGRPLFAFGNDRLAEPLDLGGIVEVSERVEPNGYKRTKVGAPHNLFAQPQTLLATSTSTPPPELFTYSDAPPSGLPPGSQIRVPFAKAVAWRYDEGRGLYVRYSHKEPQQSDGRDLTASNVVVQEVTVKDVEIVGESWVLAETVGDGDVTVFRDGVMIRGTWARPSRGSRLELRDRQGDEIHLAPGVTWVELTPV
jgi:hypothetical protein